MNLVKQKIKKMKNINLITILMFVAFAAIAQPEHHRPHHGRADMKAENPELHQALQQHFEKEVFPVLKEKKAEFDESLSRKQRKELDKLRQKGKDLKAEGRALHEKIEAEHDAGKDREAIHEMFGKQMREQKIAQMKFHDEVMDWIEANEKAVNAAMEDLKPLHEKWQAEKKSIFEENRPEGVERPEKANGERRHKGEKGECDEEHPHGEKGGEHHGHHRGKHGNREEMAAVKFVLFDGELPAKMNSEKTKITEVVPTKNLKLSAYPNPANNTTTVKFDLPNDAKLVELVITSRSGETIKNLTFNDLLKGEQAVQVDISDLQTGQYFYTIVADGLKKTEKLIVQ
jgi:hypothetical protein